MGYAHGELLKDVLETFLDSIWQFVDDEARHGAPEWLQQLPKWMFDYLVNFGLDALLDFTYEATRYYTGDYFYEEMRGLSDASGVAYAKFTRFHMIGYV